MDRVLLLSPHPDDIAWSLGGTVARLRAAGVESHGLTFFGDTVYAPGDPSHGTLAASAVRAREELAWAAWAGVTLHRHTLPDASLRGYDDDTEMGPEPEPDVVAAVIELLSAEVARIAPTVVCAPLAVGGHVDHTAVRLAASTVDCALVWYEDLPYAEGTRLRHTEHPVVIDVSRAWMEKELALSYFPSQEPHGVLPSVRSHCSEVGGERLWASDAVGAARLVNLMDVQEGMPL